MKERSTLAQGMAEYSLILAIVALAVLLVVALFGRQLAAAYQKIANALAGASSIQSIAQDFMSRTLNYYHTNGYWPPTWGSGRFTALGLNPADWQTPVSGIQWNPNGQYIGLANASGDNIQVYVKDTNGNLLHLYDGWDIWCNALSGICYYHTMGTGTQVDLSTVYVTGN